MTTVASCQPFNTAAMRLTPSLVAMLVALCASGTVPASAGAAATSASAEIRTLAPLPSMTGSWPARRGALQVRAARRSDGTLRVRAVVELTARRLFRVQVAVSPCTAWRHDGSPPGTVTLAYSGRDVVRTRRLRPGSSSRITIDASVSSNAAGDPSPRNWTDCATVLVLDDKELGPLSSGPARLQAVPALEGRALLGATVTLTTTDAHGRIMESG